MNYTVVISENKKMDLKVKDREHDAKTRKRLCLYVEAAGGKLWQKQRD